MMRYVLICYFLCHLWLGNIMGQEMNLAVCLDGKDNNLRIGMGIIPAPWTLEAWIKGDDTEWNELEVIIGCGEYGDISTIDPLPLALKHGRLYNKGTEMTAGKVFDDKWHHIAAVCDGRETILYMDGAEVGRSAGASTILPGSIGVEDVKNTFGGCIDEVRIWKAALTGEQIRGWYARSLENSHPCFQSLEGYYTFDDLENVSGLNRVGSGHRSYHLRCGRNDYYGHLPLPRSVPANNPSFSGVKGPLRLFNAVVIPSEWDSRQGSSGQQVVKLRVILQGDGEPLPLDELSLDLGGTTDLADIGVVHLYYTGHSPRSEMRQELCGTGLLPKKKMKLRPESAPLLSAGVHYFLVTFDIAEQAGLGNRLQVSIPSFRLNRRSCLTRQHPDYIPKQVIPAGNGNYLTLLQWNIWHGGLHLGETGPDRVAELLRSAGADIVTMQEAYGSQDRIAKALGFQMHTPSGNANLALFSRYPVKPLSSFDTFKSNPVIISLPDDRKLLINSCWLRYAYRPEYTCYYPEPELDPHRWVAEDSILGLEDIQNLLKEDVIPHLKSKEMGIIIGGDFNSCSHLDWTPAAKHLHYGYEAEELPISRYMYQEGFTDSFRKVNPCEVTCPVGTFAPIFGHLQTSRVDFIYYRGKLKPIASRIIRTAPEIDDVWPSDHAAVMTIFDVSGL